MSGTNGGEGQAPAGEGLGSGERPEREAPGAEGGQTARPAAAGSPPPVQLADGRAIAIRGAILAGLDHGDSPARIETAIWSASAAGVPGGQTRLLDWPAAAKENYLTDRPPGRIRLG